MIQGMEEQERQIKDYKVMLKENLETLKQKESNLTPSQESYLQVEMRVFNSRYEENINQQLQNAKEIDEFNKILEEQHWKLRSLIEAKNEAN